jgi:hypothetical protein
MKSRSLHRRTKLSQLFLCLLPASIVSPWAVVTRADPPTTAPAANEDPAAKEVRDTLVQWNKLSPTWTLAELRKIEHTENDREAIYSDYIAHEGWEECKVQKAVRDKWGSEAEAKFAHICTTDTIEDDQAADVTVDGNKAQVTFKAKEITPLPMIKIDGHWLLDMHTFFDQQSKDNADFDKNNVHTATLMKQAAADIAAGKFDDADAFLADFKTKFQALTGGN